MTCPRLQILSNLPFRLSVSFFPSLPFFLFSSPSLFPSVSLHPITNKIRRNSHAQINSGFPRLPEDMAVQHNYFILFYLWLSRNPEIRDYAVGGKKEPVPGKATTRARVCSLCSVSLSRKHATFLLFYFALSFLESFIYSLANISWAAALGWVTRHSSQQDLISALGSSHRGEGTEKGADDACWAQG